MESEVETETKSFDEPYDRFLLGCSVEILHIFNKFGFSLISLMVLHFLCKNLTDPLKECMTVNSPDKFIPEYSKVK